MILCITEKPSVAGDIAKILNCTTRRDGFYEGKDYCITWTYGHLCTLKEPHDYNSIWKRWSLSTLPMIPPNFGIKIIGQQSIERQFHVIESLIKQADEIINCGDAGQEGELIQRWVMQKAVCKIPVKRLWISSLTDDAIREGFQNLRPQKELESLYLAGLCRAIGDWILGINATRLYTLKYAQNRQILSIGRVQTPTLALVVNRQLEIENFVPKDTWELKTNYRGVMFSCSMKPFETEAAGVPILEECKQSDFVVEDVTKKKGKEAPPRLFDLTSLQVELNKKFGMGAEDTLKTIQSLYEKKIVTYPRVDTTYLTDDMYPKCKNILNSLQQYSDLLNPLRGSKLRKSKKVFDNSKVTDHHAIIPTGVPAPPNLSTYEKNAFDVIAKRFISVFYPDMIFEQTQVKGKAGKFNFKTSGKVIIDAGWKSVYAKESASLPNTETDKQKDDAEKQGEEQTTLPPFSVGESGPHNPQLVKKTSQPPKYYTEGTLLKAMETAGNQVDDEELREALKTNGIGRPSTRANIIETLYKRGYIVKERKSIRATQVAIDLMQVIKEELLKSVELTGKWEAKLRAIERNQYPPQQFINEIKELINSITISVMRDNSARRIDAQQNNSTQKTVKAKKPQK